MPRPTIVVQGASCLDDVAGLESISADAQFRFAASREQLDQQLPGADILLGWRFNDAGVRKSWHRADRLRWIHWCGAGVDALLFDELITSPVIVTNARGIFDRAMAEYALALILTRTKRIDESADLARRGYWQHRYCDRLLGQSALIVGPGSIGREVARLCRALGIEVTLVGRTHRPDDEFGEIFALQSLGGLLPTADIVVAVLPDTEGTRNVFGRDQFAAMKSNAHFINLGRGGAVVEADLYDALASRQIGAASLDVFVDEPLPPSHPFWRLDNLLISPHMSGDYYGYERDIVEQFKENLARYLQGETLNNVVDKTCGFHPGVSS